MAKKTVIKEGDVQVIGRNGEPVMTAETRSGAAEILAQANRDLGNAQIGKFFALRAGVALIVVKEMCGHGNYILLTAELMPNRSKRTLTRYVAEAHGFLEGKALMAREVWGALAKAGATALTDGGGRLQIGDGKGGGNLPAPVRAMGEWLEEREAEAPKAEKPAEKPPRGRMTKAERLKTARDVWHPMANKLQRAGITERLWEELPEDEIESLMAVIASVAVAMKQEIKNRTK